MILQQVMLILNVALVSFIIDDWSAASYTNARNRAPPAFTKQHPNIYVYDTDENGNQQDLTLPCPIDTPSDTISYTWFRENQELQESMVNGEGSLIVPNITEGEYASREGVEYYCIATDNIGYSVTARSRTITVYYAFFNGFRHMPEPGENTVEVSVPVALNSDVALECDVLDANPPPQIKWYNDMGAIQEVQQGNNVRFLENGRYLYLRRLQAAHLERLYYCTVTNANLSQEVAASIRYMLTNNIAQGLLVDYKQIGNLRAFVGNTSFEFAFVGGVFGDFVNETINTLFVNGDEVAILGNIGIIDTISIPGIVHLEAVVHYNGGLTAVRNGTMNVFQVPRITNTIQDERDLLVGEGSLTYTCQFEGVPLAVVIFYFNGAVISPDSGVTIIGSTLTISFPQVSHSGIYQCIISNEFGDDQQAWLLEIRQPISPQVQPLDFTELGAVNDRDVGALIVKNSGSTVRLSVDVVADPCPDVVWSFNGTALGSSNNTFIYNNPCIQAGGRSLDHTFTLNVVLTDTTSGSYSANFTNAAGSSLVLRAYFTLPVPVSVIGLSLNETCLKEGSNVSIRCNIRGFPRPRIKFRKNDVEITPEVGMFENILLEFYDQIVVKNVTLNDEGLYSCITPSIQGNPPQLTQKFDFCTVPHITGVDVTSNPQLGESFFIECTADGIPMPNTAWMKDGAPLEENQSIRIVTIPARKSSRLEVSNAKIEFNGEYQCIISNDAGSVMHSFIIEVTQGDNNAVPISLGLIIGIISGVLIVILVASVVILMLVCIMCRLCTNKSTQPQIASNYSANIAYLEHLQHGNAKIYRLPEEIYRLYDTIPEFVPIKAQTKGGPAPEEAQDYEASYEIGHTYEKVYYIAQPNKQSPGSKCVSIAIIESEPAKEESSN